MNVYFILRLVMAATVLLSSTNDVPVASTTELHGYLSIYNRSVAEATIEYREHIEQFPQNTLSEYDCFLATAKPEHIGDEAILTYSTDNQKSKGFADVRCLVIDSADRSGLDGTLKWFSENNIIAEIDSITAERIDRTGYKEYSIIIYDTANLYED